MHVRLYSLVLHGVSGQLVDVEVDVSSGFPQFLLVGLADTVVQEARERVRSALKNAGFKFPDGRVTVSLSPSHVRKEGGWFDLPIALGIVLASKQILDTKGALGRTIVVGEVSLDGSVRSTGKELAAAMAICDWQQSWKLMVAGDVMPVLDSVDIQRAGVTSLREVGIQLSQSSVSWKRSVAWHPEPRPTYTNPSIAGLATAQRALQVALIGRHHLLLFGPPGTGKSMLASLAQEWQPDVTQQQAVDVGRMWSAHGTDPSSIVCSATPPFRAPHHTASSPAMVGGGTPIRPGEISLAHHGILFLDELLEFRREVLESLREPMQSQHISLHRASGAVTFPADCQIVAAFNPCPCGYWGDEEKRCTCSVQTRERYRRKLSGPVLDRFAMSVRVDRIPPQELFLPTVSTHRQETTSMVRERIQSARQILRSQTLEQANLLRGLSLPIQTILTESAQAFQLSARMIHSTVRVAYSIAALDGRDTCFDTDIAEALQYRWRGWEEST